MNSKVAQTVAELTDWLLSEARLAGGAAALDEAIIDRLIKAGLPLARFTTGVPSLHPQVDSFSALWERGKAVTVRRLRQDALDPVDLERSPILIAYTEGKVARYRLEDGPVEGEYSLLTTFRKDGLTDYIVLPLPFCDGTNKAMTFATDRPGGFTEDHVAILEGLQHPLAIVVELGYLRFQAVTLMETYVGPIAGRRVLDGAIRRGSGETLQAVIWFCDLKGFTALSERLSNQQLIDTLNAYFDATTTAIEAHGGEVLKFIGDAVLAIFQPGENGDAATARSAIAAASEAVQALRATNDLRRSAGEPNIDCGIALHVGKVTYGNVGGRNRLDFTVIGPAVNLASRIESLTRELNRPVLVSEEFAALAPEEFVELGRFELKGVSGSPAVFAPRATG